MNPLSKVFFLAVLQGVTEFLPVSSSGHLVLAKHFLSLNAPGVTLEVALHTGTLLSILVYYRRRIVELLRGIFAGNSEARHYGFAILVSALPAVVVYFTLGDGIEGLFVAPGIVASMLCVTGLLLLSLLRRLNGKKTISVWRGFAVGVFQAFALVPGISRSGATIVCGRHLGLAPQEAAEFSLLMSVPVLVGATLTKALSLGHAEMGDLTLMSLLVGLLVASVVGYLAIAVLVRSLVRGRLWVFGIYCLVVGGILLAAHL